MFEKVVAADVPNLVRLMNASYRGDESKKGWTTEAHLLGGIRMNEEHLLLQIEKPNTQMIKAVDENNSLLGMVYLEEVEQYLYLGMLCVWPELQGQGVGKLLLKLGELEAKKAMKTHMKMTVISARKELIEYYERFGYVKTGEVLPFEGDGIFGDPKTDLSFVVLTKALV